MGLKLGLLTLREEHRLRVYENKEMRIYGHKMEEVAGSWRRLHEELCNLYASPSIFRVIKSRMMRWVGHITNMEEMRMHTKF
jgi:hypothetical protein